MFSRKVDLPPEDPQRKPESGEGSGTVGANAGTDMASGLASVTLSLPTFWSQNPDAWFMKVEAQFKSARITSEEKRYYKVLAVLPESAAIRVRDIALKTDYIAGDYERLKNRLIS